MRMSDRDRIGIRRGYTFVELLVVSTIVLILASAVMPLAKVTATGSARPSCGASLREMRTAIDKFKDAADRSRSASLEIKVGSEGLSAGSRDARRRRGGAPTTRPAAS